MLNLENKSNVESGDKSDVESENESVVASGGNKSEPEIELSSSSDDIDAGQDSSESDEVPIAIGKALEKLHSAATTRKRTLFTVQQVPQRVQHGKCDGLRLESGFCLAVGFMYIWNGSLMYLEKTKLSSQGKARAPVHKQDEETESLEEDTSLRDWFQTQFNDQKTENLILKKQLEEMGTKLNTAVQDSKSQKETELANHTHHEQLQKKIAELEATLKAVPSGI